MKKLSEKLTKILENPLIDTIAKTIKKFKSSKSYWSVSYALIFLIAREAVAIKWGEKVELIAQTHLADTSIEWYEKLFWYAFEFLFSNGAVWFLALLIVIFLVLSLVKWIDRKEEQSVHVTFNQTIGVTDKSLERIIAPYEKDIKRLEEQLKKSSNDEEKLKLSELLNQANEEKAKKDKEIAKLKALIDNAQYKIVKEATVVFENEGIEKALAFLQNSKTKEQEQLLNANMKEWAEKYRLEAQLLVIQNQYHKAKEAYKKALKYDRNVETLFDYAYFLQTQNYFDEAIETYNELLLEQRALAKSNPKVYNAYVADTLNNLAILYQANNQMQKAEEAYSEALTLRRALAKSNSKVYNDDVAMTLNNLAILYQANNQMQKAKEAYGEALTLYRALAKNNPKVYGIDFANSLVMGVYLLNQPSENLDEAEKVLQGFRGIPRAEWLLGKIEAFRQR